MKKKIALFTAFVLLATVVFSAMPFTFAEEADPAEYARFTAKGNDPYGTLRFSSKGKNTSINPDTVTWAAIRYRTDAQYDSTGVEYTGQFYISPASEPCIPIKYTFSNKWETTVVDMTSVNESTYLDSKWESGSYTATTTIRFDPLEPDRDSEDTSQDDVNGQVLSGDFIDVAWIAFFEKEEDARAYTGVEDTPYCICDLESFKGLSSVNNLGVTAIVGGEAEATPVPPSSDTLYYLYDGNSSVNTGWWLNPLQEGGEIRVEFVSETWFNGFTYFCYSSPADTPVTIVLMNIDEDELWTTDTTVSNNKSYDVQFDKAFPPDEYILCFIGGDTSEMESSTWFVLGSGDENDQVEVTVAGGATNGDTRPNPYIALFRSEADASYTEKPTKAPTAEPTPKPTAAPTDVPTDVPATEPAENGQVDDATDAPKATEKSGGNEQTEKKNNAPLVIGIICAAAVAIAAAVVIIIAASKKKK